MPAALGENAAHAAAQFSLAFGSLTGVTLIARGLGALQGRLLAAAWTATLIAAFALTSWAAMQAGPHTFGIVYAANLAGLASLLIWLIRGFVLRPRDPIELALGASFVSLAVTAWVRVAFALEYHGPAQADLLYVVGHANFSSPPKRKTTTRRATRQPRWWSRLVMLWDVLDEQERFCAGGVSACPTCCRWNGPYSD